MWRDDSLLFDIIYAAKRVLDYTRGVDWEHFKDNELLQDAVIRKISTIGEAASQLTVEEQEEFPDVEWSDIVGMRHRLIHNYRHVRLPVVWDVIQNDLPALIAKIEPLLPKEPRE